MSHEEDAINYMLGPDRVILHTGVIASSFSAIPLGPGHTFPYTMAVGSFYTGDTPEETLRPQEYLEEYLEESLVYYKQRIAQIEALLEKEAPEIMTQEKLRRVIEDLP